MKSRSVNSILLCIYILTWSACANVNFWKAQGFKGEVKSYVELTYAVEKKSEKWVKGAALYIGNQKTTYSPKGKFLTFESYGKNMNLLSKSVPKYDGNKRIGMLVHGSNDSLLSRSENIQSPKKVTETLNYNGADIFVGKSKRIRVSKNVLETYTYDALGKKTRYVKELLENNKVVSRSTTEYKDTLATMVMNVVYSFDEAGLMTRMKYTIEGGPVVMDEIYEYLEFDVKGNWTKRLIYTLESPKEPEKIVLREFEYY